MHRIDLRHVESCFGPIHWWQRDGFRRRCELGDVAGQLDFEPEEGPRAPPPGALETGPLNGSEHDFQFIIVYFRGAQGLHHLGAD